MYFCFSAFVQCICSGGGSDLLRWDGRGYDLFWRWLSDVGMVFFLGQEIRLGGWDSLRLGLATKLPAERGYGVGEADTIGGGGRRPRRRWTVFLYFFLFFLGFFDLWRISYCKTQVKRADSEFFNFFACFSVFFAN